MNQDLSKDLKELIGRKVADKSVEIFNDSIVEPEKSHIIASLAITGLTIGFYLKYMVDDYMKHPWKLIGKK